jgi:cytochrome c-type biogenesis protein
MAGLRGKSGVYRRSILYKSVVNTLFFVLGFTVIFVLLGAGASSLSRFLTRNTRLITIIGGSIIIILAFQIMGLFNIPFLNYERKARVRRKPKGIIGAFFIGLTFAAAWTPCIGPILSSILILAATRDTALKGILLLAAYSIGLGVPFLFAVIAFSSFLSFSDFLKRNFKTIKIVSGLLLLAVGFMLVIGQFQVLSRYLSFIPDYSLIHSERVSVLIALFAGFISFISPCVLPLIPSYLTFITGVSVLETQE